MAATPHLRAVPNVNAQVEAEHRYMEKFTNFLWGLHLFNGIGCVQREVKHLQNEAQKAGLPEVAVELDAINRALGKVRERTK